MCRLTCRQNYNKITSGLCCSIRSDDTGTTPVYTAGTCTVTSCTTTDTNGTTAPDSSGVCRLTCNDGYGKNASGVCTACPARSDETSTAPVYTTGTCTVASCTTTDTNGTAATDASGVCRLTCNDGYGKNASGVCTACPARSDETSTAPVYTTGTCTVASCTTTDTNGTAAPDASGVCRLACNPGILKTSTGCNASCAAGDTGTTTVYSSGCTISSCTTTDSNAVANISTLSVSTPYYQVLITCTSHCTLGFVKDWNGMCTIACPPGNPGTRLTDYQIGTCFARTPDSCESTDPNGTAYVNNQGLCALICNPGILKTSTGCNASCAADTGVTVTYSSGCKVATSGCMATDTNGTAATDASGVCRLTCNSGYGKNASGVCTACSAGDTGTTSVYTTGTCTVASCTTTDTNGTAATDTSGVCRLTCKGGYGKNASGVCTACPVRSDDTGTMPVYTTGTCTVSSCTTTDTNGTAATDASGVCRLTCTGVYAKNASGVCVNGLYNMTFPFTFGNMGATGRYGPTVINYTTAPGSGQWPGYGTSYQLSLGTGTTLGMQRWYVPETRGYTFTIAGAGGTYTFNMAGINTTISANGAIGIVTLNLSQGDIIRILVGQSGTYEASGTDKSSGGSGGTFVYNETTSTLLAVAGGAGGSGANGNPSGRGSPGSTTTASTAPVAGTGAGTGGSSGNGGTANSSNFTGSGGGGYTGNGGTGAISGGVGGGGLSFMNGGTGGRAGTQTPLGGFGGGGGSYIANGNGAPGGGGGYNGGGAGSYGTRGKGAGGGGSYVSTSWTSITQTNTGMGYVTVT